MKHVLVHSSDSSERPDMREDLWMWWVIAHAIAGSAGSLLSWIMSRIWGTAPAEYATLGEWMIRLAVLLFVLSLAQWFVLSMRLDIGAWWVLGTTISGGVMLPAIAEFVDHKLHFPKELVVLAGGGIVIGIVQWLLLRYHVRKAVWWMPAVALGWCGSLLIGFLVSSIMGIIWKWLTGGRLPEIVSSGVIWAVYGALTGIVLVWLLRHTLPRVPTLN